MHCCRWPPERSPLADITENLLLWLSYLMLIGPRALLQRRKIGGSEERVSATATSSTCDRDLRIVLDAASRLELWPLKILDASSGLPSGVLEGNIIDMGMYDECLSSRGKSTGVEIQGRHCMFSIVLGSDYDSLPLYPTLSACLPATCDAADVVYRAQRAAALIEFRAS